MRSGNLSVDRLVDFIVTRERDVVITVRPIREEHGEDRLTLNSADRLADVNHQRQMSKVKMRPHYNTITHPYTSAIESTSAPDLIG
jgi:hypothetical protein